ncbi:unnamed protein product, partial [marine sediment metagenome]
GIKGYVVFGDKDDDCYECTRKLADLLNIKKISYELNIFKGLDHSSISGNHGATSINPFTGIIPFRIEYKATLPPAENPPIIILSASGVRLHNFTFYLVHLYTF